MIIKIELTGAKKKTKAMKDIDRANLYQVEKWNSESVLILKESARGLKKSGRKTGQLARNVGGATNVSKGMIRSAVGTGVGGTGTVPYADKQDQGKYSKAKDGIIKPRNKKFLTIPLGGTKGTAANYPNSFILKTSAGNLLICEMKGKHGIRALFLLRRQVNIPATNWFSGPMERRMEVLTSMIQPKEVWPIAERM